jgi:hypothetical protein
MKSLLLWVAVGAIAFASHASAQNAATPDQLIDQLTQVDCNAPGLYEYSPYDDFWAVIPEPYPQQHLEGPKPDCVPDAMRALVRLGPQALPALVRHIGDARPTGLKIGMTVKPEGDFALGGQLFSDEYDPRAHVYDENAFPSAFLGKCEGTSCFAGPGFQAPYTIRVGDICFTLIGQIVNRTMVAARYQMTGWILVNSPVERPSLAERVRTDWTGVDAEGLKNALLADLRTPVRAAPPGFVSHMHDSTRYEGREASALGRLYAGALRRLRFYFPDAYAALSGDDLAKRTAFERDEDAERHMRPPAMDTEPLIDALTSLNCPLPGVSDTGTFGGFLAEDDSLQALSTVLFGHAGSLRYPLPCQNTDVLNLMHVGPAALPALLRHIRDKRPTKLVVGRRSRHALATFGGQFFAGEYDARHQTWPLIGCGAGALCKMKSFDGPYTVRVGDICFVLIGQIVNRQLNAVRYQPTAIVMVNSPIETPALGDRVRADWSGVDAQGVKASLLDDLHATRMDGAPDATTQAGALDAVQEGALRRLRYYFPEAYVALTGADLEKRRTFETAERARGQD